MSFKYFLSASLYERNLTMFYKKQTFLSFSQTPTPNQPLPYKICAIFECKNSLEQKKFISLYAEITNNKTKNKEQKIKKTENK